MINTAYSTLYKAPDPNDAGAYFVRGTVYLDKSDYDNAIADFTKTMELDPRFAEAYHHRSIAYNEKGEKGKGIRAEIGLTTRIWVIVVSYGRLKLTNR